jgi:hypothetical protein
VGGARALLAGLAVLTAVGLVPVLGGLVGLTAVVFGLGALVLTLFQTWRGPSAAAPRPTACGSAGTMATGQVAWCVT